MLRGAMVNEIPWERPFLEQRSHSRSADFDPMNDCLHDRTVIRQVQIEGPLSVRNVPRRDINARSTGRKTAQRFGGPAHEVGDCACAC